MNRKRTGAILYSLSAARPVSDAVATAEACATRSWGGRGTMSRAKLIVPALHRRGWTEYPIKREETAGGRTDYTLRMKVNPDTQPVAVAILEAKAEHLPPTAGLEQAKWYGLACQRLNVPFPADRWAPTVERPSRPPGRPPGRASWPTFFEECRYEYRHGGTRALRHAQYCASFAPHITRFAHGTAKPTRMWRLPVRSGAVPGAWRV
jgi:hypothetical protein